MFWVNWLKFSSVPFLFEINNLPFCEIYGYKKKERLEIYFPLPHLFCYWIRGGSGIKIPDPSHWFQHSDLSEPFSMPNLTHSTFLQHIACLPAVPKMYLYPCLFQVNTDNLFYAFSCSDHSCSKFNLLQPILTSPNLVNRFRPVPTVPTCSNMF